MKETVLTSSELGEYAANYTRTCTASDVTNGNYGCTTEGETVTQARDTMSYYWSDTCHYEGYYGYTAYDTSGCEGHNDYEGSKVREYLEGTYINTLGSDNLKEIDGYKIRLITTDELKDHLGWKNVTTHSTTFALADGNDVPSWIYENFGEISNRSNGVSSYYTMTPENERSYILWSVYSLTQYDGASVRTSEIYDSSIGVRPVINLLKSSI